MICENPNKKRQALTNKTSGGFWVALAVFAAVLALITLGWPEIDPILDQLADAGRPVEVRR